MIMKELVEIQTRLKAPKGQYNAFGKYKYRSCEDILEAVKPILSEQKCTLVIADDIILVGSRIYVKATATIKNEKGETEVVTAFAREEEGKKGMDASQVTGAASSYARKYALNGLFCIDDNKDSDATNTGDSRKPGNSNPEPPDFLTMALQEIRAAQSLAGLRDIYNNYACLQSNKIFVESVKKRKKDLEVQ